MSTDVYFDLSTNSDSVADMPLRIGYLYNFILGQNFERFDGAFYALCTGALTADKIGQIVEAYRAIFDTAQADPENLYKDDMVSPDDIKETLDEHFGCHIRLRVD